MQTAADVVEVARKRIEELSREIDHHRFCYYVLDNQEISDANFDVLFNELKALEEKYPELKLPNSPTQTVGAPPSTEFKSVKHRIPLLSLANAMDGAELEKWNERLVRALDDPERQLSYVCELKIDGLSIAITYKDGKLVEGATRGNGEVGEDVTLNLKTIGALPHKLKPIERGGKFIVPELVEVRGEVYFPVTSFQKLNEQLLEQGDQSFANPRNAASGSLRQKNPKKTAERKLSVWIYSVYITDKNMGEPKEHIEDMKVLSEFGFPVEPNHKLAKSIDEVKAFCDEWSAKRHDLNYQTDGVVVKLNERELWGHVGSTAHSPRWAVAFKYPPEEADTVVEDIQFDVGRTGAVTPVAWLRPVKLAGTKVKRATLHNADQIKKLDVRVGDTVVVRKAGEIIPEVLSVKVDRRDADSKPFEYPTRCPVCDSQLERIGTEVVFRCPNTYGCPTQIRRRLDHWVSRDAMDIDHVGESLIDQLVTAGLISRPSDLYKLTEAQLMSLERMGQKSANNVIASIDKSKSRPLANLIFALGIRHVGSSVGELLADKFNSLQELEHAQSDQITSIEGIGPKIAVGIVEFFENPESQKLVRDLEEVGVKLDAGNEDKVSLPQTFAGKSFVVTGTLANMDRSTAEKSVKARGGKISSSVSKKTDFVVVGESPGSKAAKAAELGITVLNEEQFLAKLEEQ